MKTTKAKLQPNTMHSLQKASAVGHGSWMQCPDCGATKHSGLWWFAGYKSKDEPPCSPKYPNDYAGWKKSAELHVEPES